MASAVDSVNGPRLSILIFHRVMAEQDPIFPGEMHAERFDRLCAFLARNYRVMTLAEANDARSLGKLPARALVITFDDGYADNATIALPLLQKHGLRATFFVATGFLDGGRMWNDTIIESIRRTGQKTVDLSSVGLGATPASTLAQRRGAIEAALSRVKYLSLDERPAAIKSIWQDCGRPVLPDDLMMRSEQVRALHVAGMEIGGHTVNHPILCSISDEQARTEICSGRDRLQELIGTQVRSFAYPNGGPDRDYDQRHVAMVRDAGFQVAVSTAAGVVGRHADRLQLPRFSPWDQDLARWSMRLLMQRIGSTKHRQAVAPRASGVAASA
jgi:peptidoglycan/xylan/chitin deacetylase (PgdA/CDA1 family)